MVIWLVGLSGAGKTTIGRALYRRWKQTAPNLVMVDGDEVRQLFRREGAPAHYSLAARRENAERMVELCAWLDRQQIHVVCTILCLFDDLMQANRERFSAYFQVYLDTDLAVLRQRDPKGIYAASARGEGGPVAGVDLPFSPPTSSDLVLTTNPGAPMPEQLAERILTAAGIDA